MTTVNANEVALGIESFGDDDAPLVLLAGGEDDALGDRRALRAPRRRRAPRGALRPPRQRRVHDDGPRSARVHLARPRRRRRGPCRRARRWPRAPRGDRRQRDRRPGRRARPSGSLARSRRSPWPAPAPGPARPARRRSPRPRQGDDEAAVRRGRCPTGPTATRWPSSPPPAGRSSATTPSTRGRRSPRASGTARPAPQPRSRWPTSWAWCSPSSTANPAGTSACPRSRSPRSSSTATATRSSLSATARRCLVRSPGAAARPRRGRHCDPRLGGTSGRRGNAHARVGGRTPPGNLALFGARQVSGNRNPPRADRPMGCSLGHSGTGRSAGVEAERAELGPGCYTGAVTNSYFQSAGSGVLPYPMRTRPGATTCCMADCSGGWRHGRSKPSTVPRVGGRQDSPSTCSDRPRWRSWRSTCDRFEPAGASRSPTRGCVATVTTSGERRPCSWPRAKSRLDGSGGLGTSRGPILTRSRRPRRAHPTTPVGGSGSCGVASALVSKPGSGPGRQPASSTTSQCRRSCVRRCPATSRVRSPTAATTACTTSTPTTRC